MKISRQRLAVNKCAWRVGNTINDGHRLNQEQIISISIISHCEAGAGVGGWVARNVTERIVFDLHCMIMRVRDHVYKQTASGRGLKRDSFPIKALSSAGVLSKRSKS